MPSLLSAAKYLVKECGFTPIYINDPMFPDPIISASQSDVFEALHILTCAATGANPAYINVRRVVDWVSQKGKAANA